MTNFRIRLPMNIIFFGIVVLITITLNYWYYIHLQQNLKNQINKELNLYDKIIKAGFIEPLQQTMAGYPTTSFSKEIIFKTEPNLHNTHIQNTTKITPYSVELFYATHKVILDIVSVKEYFDNILPQHIEYSILFASTAIVLNESRGSTYINKSTYVIGDEISLDIELLVTKNHLLKYERSIRSSLYIFSAVSSLFAILIVVIYFINSFILKRRVTDTKRILVNAEQTISCYQEMLATRLEFNTIFIKKATKIYLEYNSRDKKNITRIFPLILHDDQQDLVKLTVLCGKLEKYFSIFDRDIQLRLSHDINEVQYGMSREALYQIVLSVVRNIALVIKNQTDHTKSINVQFYANTIKFMFDSFPINFTKLQQLSSMVCNKEPEIFCLDFSKIVFSLAKHQAEYQFSNQGKTHCFEVCFGQENISKNVIPFQRKRN